MTRTRHEVKLTRWHQAGGRDYLNDFIHTESLAYNGAARSMYEFCRHVNARSKDAAAIWYDGKIIGHILFGFRRAKRSSPTRYCEIHDVVIQPDYQEVGLGRKAVQKLVENISSSKTPEFRCVVPESRTDLHCWLKRCGFFCYEIDYNLYGDGKHGYRFNLITEFIEV